MTLEAVPSLEQRIGGLQLQVVRIDYSWAPMKGCRLAELLDRMVWAPMGGCHLAELLDSVVFGGGALCSSQ